MSSYSFSDASTHRFFTEYIALLKNDVKLQGSSRDRICFVKGLWPLVNTILKQNPITSVFPLSFMKKKILWGYCLRFLIFKERCTSITWFVKACEPIRSHRCGNVVCSNSNNKKDTYSTDKIRQSRSRHVTAILVPKLHCATDVLLWYVRF